MVKYIHAADIHLDSPFKGLKNIPEALFNKIKASTFNAFEKLVDTALFHQVDFVLLSGDIYDLEDRSIRAQVFLREEIERLNQAGISVFIIHGNHDYLTNDELHLSLPNNVTVFDSNVETIQFETQCHETISISGFSYDRNWIEERKIKDYPYRNNTSDFHIGMLHGYMEGESTSHAHYAPFTLNELKEKNYDYWALGHIHKRQQLSKEPLIYYSGNTQGRHKNEAGEKGCLLVELKKSSKKATFIPTADIKWQTINMDLTTLKTIDGMFDEIKRKITEKEYLNSLINLNIKLSPKTPKSIVNTLQDDAFYQNFQHVETDSFTYIVSASISQRDNKDTRTSLLQTYPIAFDKALQTIGERETFQKLTQDFFSKYAFTKYIEDDMEEIKKNSLDSAKNILMQDLGEEISYDN